MATTTHTSKPVITFHDRIDVIDVLRGFALLGIIISHLTSSFSSGIPRFTGRVDMVLYKAVELFIMDKFYLIFSFLFGLSFFIQLQRATARKVKFVSRFIWRSVILLIIGNIHTLFYTGDVLHTYAILGLLLLVGNKLNNKVLVLISCLLIFGSPWLLKLPDMINWKQPAEIAMEKAADNSLMQQAAQIRQKGTLTDVIGNNIELAKRFYFTIIDRYIVILGLFLLGVVAGRKNLFNNTPANIKIFVKMLIYGIVSAIAAMVLVKANIAALGGAKLVIPIILQIALSCTYVAGVVLLYWKTPFKTILQVLSPVGKMGLTIYLMQSVFGLLFYYGFGFGMASAVSVKVSFAAVMVFFVFQVIFAALWMSRFRYGPMEWLWRSLTYLKLQPIKK